MIETAIILASVAWWAHNVWLPVAILGVAFIGVCAIVGITLRVLHELGVIDVLSDAEDAEKHTPK